jgi:aminoglycoside phosphotransferase (APT) family kinase protein/ketosteroid isomerase-like protein
VSQLDDLERSIAIEAIEQLKARYFRCLDDRDYDELRALFADDAVISTSAGRQFDGADSFLAFLRDPANRPRRTVHHGHLPEIELTSPTTAKGTWALHANAEVERDGELRSIERFGRYHDEYGKQGDAWMIVRQRLDMVPAAAGRTGDPAIALLQRLGPLVATTCSGGRIAELRRLEGGFSSETFAASVEGASDKTRFVLKVAPRGVAPVRNRDVLRQARVLRALSADERVRVPAVLFEDPGDPPDVPPLFAMTWVEGENLEPNLDAVAELPPTDEIAGRARDAARQLAYLHAVDPLAIGIDEEPAVSLADEIGRWDRAFETVPDDLAPGAAACSVALHGSQPHDRPPSLTHGDFRLGNTLCRAGAVEAIIDWELWSLGDPRIDLAWFLLTADPEMHPSLVRAAPGMPAPDTLLAEYVEAGGRDPGHLEWFRALVLYKLAATSALLVKRDRKQGMNVEATARAAATIPLMVDRAHALLDGER